MGHGHSNPGRARRELQRDIAEDRASREGADAAAKGIPYDQNPYTQMGQFREKLAWSTAHNGMRARMASDREEAGSVPWR